MRNQFLGAVFDEYVRPRARQDNVPLSEKDMGILRNQFSKRMMGESPGPLPEDFAKQKLPEPNTFEKALSVPTGMAAKATGIVKTLLDWEAKADKFFGASRENRVDKFLDKMRETASKMESEEWETAQRLWPAGATAGALGGELAMLSGPARGASMLVPKAASKAPLALKMLSRAGRGAAGVGAFKAGTTTDPGEIGTAAAIGGVAGPILDPAIEKLEGMIGSRLARRAAVGARAPAKATSQLDEISQAKFKKNWSELAPDERQVLIQESAASAKAARDAARAKTTKAPSAKAAAKPTVGAVATPADTAANAKWRQAQYVKLSKAGFSTKEVNISRAKVRQGITAEQILAKRMGIGSQIGATVAPSEKLAASAIAQAENPQVADAVKGLTKVAEGVHGEGPLGKRAAKAESEAAARAKAASEAPRPEVGFTETGEAVPLAERKLPAVEALDAMKQIKVPGFDVSMVWKAIEGARKAGRLSEDDMYGAMTQVYRAMGAKLGIEDTEGMSLEELFVRLTGAR